MMPLRSARTIFASLYEWLCNVIASSRAARAKTTTSRTGNGPFHDCACTAPMGLCAAASSVPKRGLSGLGSCHDASALKLQQLWHYNWGPLPHDAKCAQPLTAEFVPMIWGCYGNCTDGLPADYAEIIMASCWCSTPARVQRARQSITVQSLPSRRSCFLATAAGSCSGIRSSLDIGGTGNDPLEWHHRAILVARSIYVQLLGRRGAMQASTNQIRRIS